jgi:hypothetical protein
VSKILLDLLQRLKPTFSGIHGKNITRVDNHSQGTETLKWKFSESQGIAFSDLPLIENRKYEAIFTGSGHASIGLTQTDPENLKNISEAKKNNQIVYVTDIRFHKRQCTVDIVKKKDGRSGVVLETRYQDGSTQEKVILHTADVWIVICLKFGEISAEFKGQLYVCNVHLCVNACLSACLLTLSVCMSH